MLQPLIMAATKKSNHSSNVLFSTTKEGKKGGILPMTRGANLSASMEEKSKRRWSLLCFVLTKAGHDQNSELMKIDGTIKYSELMNHLSLYSKCKQNVWCRSWLFWSIKRLADYSIVSRCQWVGTMWLFFGCTCVWMPSTLHCVCKPPTQLLLQPGAVKKATEAEGRRLVWWSTLNSEHLPAKLLQKK